MALVRCNTHGHPKGRGGREYVRAVEPLGYPQTAGAICGALGCEQPGLLWLDRDEADAYDRGQRVFGFNTNVMKVRVK